GIYPRLIRSRIPRRIKNHGRKLCPYLWKRKLFNVVNLCVLVAEIVYPKRVLIDQDAIVSFFPEIGVYRGSSETKGGIKTRQPVCQRSRRRPFKTPIVINCKVIEFVEGIFLGRLFFPEFSRQREAT